VNILLIDDDATCLKTLAYILKVNKQAYRTFTVPEQAVESYEQEDYDAVVTDMKMPGLNGIQVLQRIRSLNPEAKVIIMTANWDAESAIAAVNYGACALLVKPLKLDSLMSVLKKIELEKRARQSAKNEHV